MGNSKFVVNNQVLLDLTADTVTSATLLKGTTAHDKAGEAIVGTYSAGGGGIDGVAYGTHTQASNVASTANTKITDVATIGFTPKHFYLWRDGVVKTANYCHKYTFNTFNTTYSRSYGRYTTNTSTVTTTGVQTAWTTSANGHLYFNSNNVYVRSTSSYVFPAGTWHWLAVRD